MGNCYSSKKRDPWLMAPFGSHCKVRFANGSFFFGKSNHVVWCGRPYDPAHYTILFQNPQPETIELRICLEILRKTKTHNKTPKYHTRYDYYITVPANETILLQGPFYVKKCHRSHCYKLQLCGAKQSYAFKWIG